MWSGAVSSQTGVTLDLLEGTYSIITVSATDANMVQTHILSLAVDGWTPSMQDASGPTNHSGCIMRYNGTTKLLNNPANGSGYKILRVTRIA